MTWETLSLGLAPEHDGHAGVMSIGDAHLTVRKWRRNENGTISAEVAKDVEWTKFLQRLTALVAGG